MLQKIEAAVNGDDDGYTGDHVNWLKGSAAAEKQYKPWR
jgi:hypothetical protein